MTRVCPVDEVVSTQTLHAILKMLLFMKKVLADKYFLDACFLMGQITCCHGTVDAFICHESYYACSILSQFRETGLGWKLSFLSVVPKSCKHAQGINPTFTHNLTDPFPGALRLTRPGNSGKQFLVSDFIQIKTRPWYQLGPPEGNYVIVLTMWYPIVRV